jgi:plastocyanin
MVSDDRCPQSHRRLNPIPSRLRNIERVGSAHEEIDPLFTLSAGLITMLLAIIWLADGSRAQALVSCSPGSVGVAIADFSFTPSMQFVDVGDTVCWTWVQGFHSTTSNSAVWNSGQLSSPNNFEFTFSSSGIYPYFCSVHQVCKERS